MEGYCGRAVVAGQAVHPSGQHPRPVAILQRPRGRVVRIGPPPLAPDREPLARAA
jgi:hypothetical protein